MAKKKQSTLGSVFRNIGILIKWFFERLWLAIEWLGYLIWDIIHRIFELIFWFWGFALLTILIATLAFLFLSLGIKALDQTTYSENIMRKFLPQIVEQQQTESLPDILSEFSETNE